MENLITFLEDKKIKYSQGIIFWRFQLNIDNNSNERNVECRDNISKYLTLYKEMDIFLNEIKESN